MVPFSCPAVLETGPDHFKTFLLIVGMTEQLGPKHPSSLVWKVFWSEPSDTHVFEFKQDLPVQLDAFPVGVFYSHDVSLREHKEKITLN